MCVSWDLLKVCSQGHRCSPLNGSGALDGGTSTGAGPGGSSPRPPEQGEVREGLGGHVTLCGTCGGAEGQRDGAC